MKVIIIDDEKHVRESIMLLAKWERHGIEDVFEAQDGEEAKDIIVTEQPEIIFTDMDMPIVDGIDLFKWLDAKAITSKTIVISGHADFHYMRNAIFYGSYDYILKPIDPEILNNTLERAIQEWNEEEINRKSVLEYKQELTEVKPFYWDHLLSGTIHQANISPSVVTKIKDEFAINLNHSPYRVAILSIRAMIETKVIGDMEQTFSTLLDFCKKVISKNKDGICFRNINKDDEIILVFCNSSKVEAYMNQLEREIFEFTHMHSTIAIGGENKKLVDAYQSALTYLLKRNLMEQNNKPNRLTISEIDTRPVLHILDFSKDIKWALQSGSLEQIDNVLDGIFSALESSHNLSLEQLKVWEEQFELLTKNWLKEYEINEALLLYKGVKFWDSNGNFNFEKFKQEKRKEFYDLIQCLHDAKFKTEKSSIQKIEDYLRQNYDHEVTLQEIADRFFLSREYISRKFKEEFGETITDYVTKIRIEKARELLVNPHLKIYEVAYNVGYQNEKYFSKVFKKRVGKSPNEYRSTSLSS
ncbi:response regulator transcription factor [Aquibacillus albus]|uniref:Two-component system response regulator YesN n=1 Tax=Aquibacillus albus TaxID=1168171 RepID=A0ABS2MWE0_9BACI|nr:helix-turn-helix domain-containing protein [Aquibacillus albus]MBM7570166.1 two-component system response regulator YesN [Aquibacillus albus]